MTTFDMTDAERQKLIKWLRDMQWRYGASTEYGKIADKIERLAALVQSDPEPSLSDQMYGFHGAGFDSTTPEHTMTDEERKRLVADLRATGFQCFHTAADEIERLAKELLIEKGALEICQGELNMAFDKIEHLTERVKQLEKAVEASGRM